MPTIKQQAKVQRSPRVQHARHYYRAYYRQARCQRNDYIRSDGPQTAYNRLMAYAALKQASAAQRLDTVLPWLLRLEARAYLSAAWALQAK